MSNLISDKPIGCVKDVRYSRFSVAMGLMVAILAGYPQATAGVFVVSVVSIYLAMTAITGLDPVKAALDLYAQHAPKRIPATDGTVPQS